MSRKTPEEIDARALQFHNEHLQVWTQFTEFTFALINRGYTNHSACFVFHRIRWETAMGSDRTKDFKLNNNHRRFYAIRFAELYPDHAKFFRTRQRPNTVSRSLNQPNI